MVVAHFPPIWVLHIDRRRSIYYEAQRPLDRQLFLLAISLTHLLYLELFVDHLVDVIELGKKREESLFFVHFGQDIRLNRLYVLLRQLLALLLQRILVYFPDLLEIHLGVGTEGQLVEVTLA